MRSYAELQSKQRATYGDDDEAREAAGKAALLREAAIKESLWLSTGWAARLGCEQRRGRACATPRPPRQTRSIPQKRGLLSPKTGSRRSSSLDLA